MSPLAGMFASKLDEPGPYEAPRQSADFEDGAPYYGVLSLDAPLGEQAAFTLLGGASSPLHELTERLRTAAKDEALLGLVVRLDRPDFDLVHAYELRAALLAFKQGGERTIWCHTEGVGDAGYLVLTACDHVAMAPLAELAITGPAATPIHFKGLLDRLGITADALHVGAFKGAAEPLTREAPSPEMIATLEAIVEGRYQTELAAIADARGLSREQAIAAIDRGMFDDREAITAKLADESADWPTFLERARQGKPWKTLRGATKLGDLTALQRFLGLLPPERPSDSHVALVYATGSIVDGDGNGLLGAREQIASRTLVAALRAIAADDKVAAVVLRVDSGGGSALASEQIWHAASELAARKPLVVSMGSVAASGGYYISAPAQRIFANADTLTGSIGVVGMKLVLGDALRGIGVTTHEVRRGERATMWSSMRQWSDGERTAIEAMMRATYDVFVDRVAAGRKLDRAAVEPIAQGRVWTGNDAKARGLVDAIGTLQDALDDAHTRGGVAPGTALEVYPPEPTLRDIIASLGQAQLSTGASLALVDRALAARAAEDAPGAPASGLVAAIAAPAARLHAGGRPIAPTLALARMLATVLALQESHVWAVSPAMWLLQPR